MPQNYSEQIDKALLAHGAWKYRLTLAVEKGASEFNVSQTQVDNRCDFGRWYYSLPVDLRSTEVGKKIQTLHAEFHREAARVLDLATHGNKTQALKALEPGGPYAEISGHLALTLRQWQKDLGK